jgi:hypothetical protein
MKKIANIVSDKTIDVSELFNVVKTMGEIEHGLPTLIVDYDYVVKNYPDFDITSMSLGDKLYWTVKKTQKRDKFNHDLNYFINKVYSDMINGVTYLFVDFIQYKTTTFKRILQKISEYDDIITYQHNQMVYMYSNNLVFGIDLKLAEYVGLDVTKLISKIKLKSHVFLTDNEILIEYKKSLEEMDFQVKYIPYLVSIINE